MSCVRHVARFSGACRACLINQLTSQLMMRTRKLETAMQQLSVLGEELRIARADLCRAQMSLERRTEDAERFAKQRDRFELALRRIGVLVQEPRAALLVKIRAELKEAGL